MLGYLPLDIIFSSKLTVFLELRFRKTGPISGQLMSADKYPSIFSPQMGAIVYICVLVLFPRPREKLKPLARQNFGKRKRWIINLLLAILVCSFDVCFYSSFVVWLTLRVRQNTAWLIKIYSDTHSLHTKMSNKISIQLTLALRTRRYYGQNSDPRQKRLTGNDSRYYELSLSRPLNDVPRVSAITRVDCM